MKLNNQEKQDLDKFARYLALKTTQVIVQSRLGEKASTACKPKVEGTNWFNLNINDIPEVLVEAKRVLNEGVITSQSAMCVEISLRTVEGVHMVLETWYLSSSSEQCETIPRILNIIYNHMSILLKSLISVSRVLPAYKLSRRQGSDSFIMCYRMYIGEPQLHCLGEDSKFIKIGQICTPLRTFTLSVSYRTRMTISPTQTSKNDSIILKSDHFDTNVCPKIRKQNEKENISLSDKMKIGAFADQKNKTSGFVEILPTPPISKLFKQNVVPEKGSEKISEEVEKNEVPTEPSTNTLETRMDSLTMVSTNDDFIMVDLKTPFANTNENSELGLFFREWQSAPPLQTFKNVTPPEELDVARQLETFESDLNEFDSVVQSYCSSESSS